MSNSNVNLPVPAANGAGAAQDVSALGPVREVVVGGSYVGVVHVQVTNEAAPAASDWVTIASFPTGGGKKTIEMAARSARAVMAGFQSGAGNCDMAGWLQACEFQAMAVPAGVGVGAALDVSNMDAFKSVVVGGAFSGNVIIEISNDGVAWSPWKSTSARAVLSGVLPTAQMRVRRTTGAAGAPVITVGSGNIEEGGGDNLAIAELLITQQAQDEGTPTAALIIDGGAHTDLDNTEVTDVSFLLARTINFDGGGAAMSLQRSFVIESPTLTADAAQVIDIAATVAIEGEPVAGANVTITEAWALRIIGPEVIEWSNLGATSVDADIGLLLRNGSPAAAGAQQFSPMLVLEGQGWKTNAAADTMEVQGAIQVVPVEGAALPTMHMKFFTNVNEGGFTELVRIDSSVGALETPLWLFQGSVAGMRKVTLAAAAGGQHALQVAEA